MNKKRTALLGIDLQNDFCVPPDPSGIGGGALFVNGAVEDAQRIANMIENHLDEIDHVALTFDSHRRMDISHASWWIDQNGKQVAPFTQITLADMDSGKYRPTQDPLGSRQYIDTLEREKEFPHYIWPDHCIIGTWGHNIVDPVMRAVHAWERKRGGIWGAEYVTKGTNPRTEHFGAFQAQVPLPNAPETQANLALLSKLESFERTLFAGEAASHCCVTSLRQIMRLAPNLVKKLVILEDCMSDVKGFEGTATKYFDEAKKLGARFTTADKAFSVAYATA